MERNTNTSSLKRTRFEARKNIPAPWTDNCMGWVPPYSQIYVGILFYIQTFRAMECAGLLSPGSEILSLLNGFRTQYSMNDVYVPGPLVQCFKNISCFSPTATDRFGNVSPSIPARPGWSQNRSYRLQDHLTTHLPNIYLFASRLRSTCNVATCANIDNLGCCPVLLDVDKHEVDNNWTSFLGFDESIEWFGSLNAMMAKYCQFWRASRPLSECPPGGFAAGAVICRQLSGSYSTNLAGMHQQALTMQQSI
ncbi:hypothetical protein P8452_25914 [Trifolium repens]|nr:hypothetical protein P8452_25914 [Trifolium repens]